MLECGVVLSVCVLTVCVCVCRLVYRKLYPLAIEICRYLKTPEYQGVSRVLKHWACCKVCVSLCVCVCVVSAVFCYLWLLKVYILLLACQVQQKEEADDVIARAVSVKLAEAAGISYSEIATRAYECGRTELAIKVCTHTHTHTHTHN